MGFMGKRIAHTPGGKRVEGEEQGFGDDIINKSSM